MVDRDYVSFLMQRRCWKLSSKSELIKVGMVFGWNLETGGVCMWCRGFGIDFHRIKRVRNGRLPRLLTAILFTVTLSLAGIQQTSVGTLYLCQRDSVLVSLIVKEYVLNLFIMHFCLLNWICNMFDEAVGVKGKGQPLLCFSLFEKKLFTRWLCFPHFILCKK